MPKHIHTHYDNLKIARDAPPSVIRAAYKALSQQYHPDKNPGNAEAARIMTIINQAYGLLSDPIKRKQYDQEVRNLEQTAATDRPSNNGHHTEPPTPPRQSPPSRPMAPSTPPHRSDNSPWVPLLAAVILFGGAVLLAANPDNHDTTTPHPNRTMPDAKAEPSHAANAQPTSQATASSSVTTPLSENNFGRVSAPQLNVRQGPGVQFAVVGKLNYANSLKIRESLAGGWLAITSRVGEGYVNGQFVERGDLVSSFTRLCTPDKQQPKNGAILLSKTTGNNSLILTAPANSDALVKLKDTDNNDIFLAFVEQGKTVAFNAIPNGHYRTWFETGIDYSSKCLRFTRDVVASYDDKWRDYYVQNDGVSLYRKTIEYRLQTSANGNFLPSSAVAGEF